jgi:hypothetical protein
MKRMSLFLAIAAFTAACGAMIAQTPQSAGIVYQQAGVISVQLGADGRVTTMGRPTMASGIADVAGSPLSATEQSHSLQVLGDGTRIETTESRQVYRDSVGRTRVEGEPRGSATVMIQDPVSGVMVLLDPVAKTAEKMVAPTQRISIPGRTEAQFSISTGGGYPLARGRKGRLAWEGAW